MPHVNESGLTLLLRKAARAHAAHADHLGGSDAAWEQWYARFIVRHLREQDDRE